MVAGEVDARDLGFGCEGARCSPFTYTPAEVAPDTDPPLIETNGVTRVAADGVCGDPVNAATDRVVTQRGSAILDERCRSSD